MCVGWEVGFLGLCVCVCVCVCVEGSKVGVLQKFEEKKTVFLLYRAWLWINFLFFSLCVCVGVCVTVCVCPTGEPTIFKIQVTLMMNLDRFIHDSRSQQYFREGMIGLMHCFLKLEWVMGLILYVWSSCWCECDVMFSAWIDAGVTFYLWLLWRCAVALMFPDSAAFEEGNPSFPVWCAFSWVFFDVFHEFLMCFRCVLWCVFDVDVLLMCFWCIFWCGCDVVLSSLFGVFLLCILTRLFARLIISFWALSTCPPPSLSLLFARFLYISRSLPSPSVRIHLKAEKLRIRSFRFADDTKRAKFGFYSKLRAFLPFQFRILKKTRKKPTKKR